MLSREGVVHQLGVFALKGKDPPVDAQSPNLRKAQIYI